MNPQGRHVKKSTVFPALFCFLAIVSPVLGQDSGSEAGTTLPPGEAPIPVKVGIYLLDITNIDETRNTFDVELDVIVNWTDPRRAFDAEVAGTDRRIHVGAEAEDVRVKNWNAQIGLANPVGQMGVSAEKLTIFADGRVEISAQINATCRTNLNYRDFPFDKQVLPITLESFAWNVTEVQLVPNEARTGFAPEFSLPEWEVVGLDRHEEDVIRVRDATAFSNLSFDIKIERKSGYYLWKIFLTVFIIVALTWVVFWMSDERLGRRAGVSSGGILTVIAYQFVTTSSLPRVSYLTVADRVMTLSIVTIAATMVVSIIVDRIDPANQALKLKIDRTCRWVFPLVYLLLMVGLMAKNGLF
jgi:hypothetical protein